MSMNLHLKVNGNGVDLIQTPTFISHLLMTDDNGKEMFEAKGKKAKGVLQRYITYLRYLRQKEFNNSTGSGQKRISDYYDSLITIASSYENENLYFFIM
jgi:hypothetical protein